MAKIYKMDLSRKNYNDKLINFINKIKILEKEYQINIKITMENELTKKTLESVKKLFSNPCQNLKDYNVMRNFYFVISLNSFDDLVKFIKQDLETNDALVETPTPLPGDEIYQGFNFWKEISIKFYKNDKYFGEINFGFEYIESNIQYFENDIKNFLF
uniref:Putative secretion chaperone-like protein n=1 Tax=Borely moumouvirus TaxID=2712067 RepID=A0A6G6ADT6_9VIRU